MCAFFRFSPNPGLSFGHFFGLQCFCCHPLFHRDTLLICTPYLFLVWLAIDERFTRDRRRNRLLFIRPLVFCRPGCFRNSGWLLRWTGLLRRPFFYMRLGCVQWVIDLKRVERKFTRLFRGSFRNSCGLFTGCSFTCPGSFLLLPDNALGLFAHSLLVLNNALCLFARFGGFLLLPDDALGLFTHSLLLFGYALRLLARFGGFLILPAYALCVLARFGGIILGLYARMRLSLIHI